MPEWSEFARVMDAVDHALSRLGLRQHQEAFFRGHGDERYRLIPSLFRQLGNRPPAECWKIERRIFMEFRARARALYQSVHTDWDVLFHMQHHGVPTRLLDWTSVFGVALHFALLDYDESAGQLPCIWVLNPYALNHATWRLYRLFSPRYLARDESSNRSYDFGELLLGTHPPHWKDRLLWDTPLAVYCEQRSERMYAQSGWFTIHGTDGRAIEEIFPDRLDILQKVEIPKPAIPGARAFLRTAGIGDMSLFPDLDGLARSICQRFGLRLSVMR